jgi:lactoylglutathione lyase
MLIDERGSSPAKETVMAARLRHIALSVPDPDKAAKFFEEAFGMKVVGKAGIGCYVSDGTVNVALLKYEGEVPGFAKGYHGLVHFGMWVDDLEETAKKVTDAGATHFSGAPQNNPNAFYEVKYKDPNGVIFDLTHNGWRGAVKEVVPAEPEKVPAE